MSIVEESQTSNEAIAGGPIPEGFGLAAPVLESSENKENEFNVSPPNDDLNVSGTLVDASNSKPAAEQVDTGVDKEQDEDIIDILVPSAEPREQKIGDRVYVQKPLSFFARLRFFKVVAKGLKKVVNDGGGDGLAEMLNGPQSLVAELGLGDPNEEAAKFVELAASIADSAPEVLEDSYVIWLGVPVGSKEGEWLKAAMRGDIAGVPALSDDDGIEILKTFVVQNWEAMQSFFGQLRDLGAVVRLQTNPDQTDTKEQ